MRKLTKGNVHVHGQGPVLELMARARVSFAISMRKLTKGPWHVATAFVLGPVQSPTQCPVLGQGLALPCTWPCPAAPRTVTFALSNRNRGPRAISHGPVTWPCALCLCLWHGPVPCAFAFAMVSLLAVTDIAKVLVLDRALYRCGGDVPVHANICVGKGQGPVHGHVQWQGRAHVTGPCPWTCAMARACASARVYLSDIRL